MKESDTLPYALSYGKIIPVELATTSLLIKGLHYGQGSFAGIRAYKSSRIANKFYIFRIHDHIDRLYNALKIMGVTCAYDKEFVKKSILELAKRNSAQSDFYIRLLAYSDSRELVAILKEDLPFELLIYMTLFGIYKPIDTGLKAAICTWQRLSDGTIPPRGKISGGYINAALAKQEVFRNGYDEAIMLDPSGHVTEGSTCNIFVVRNDTLITPPVSAGILEGITRDTVLKLAHDAKIPILERVIDRTELYIADEVFFTGTGMQITYAESVDKRRVGDGSRGRITAQLQDKYFSVCRGEDSSYYDWLTEVEI